MAAAEQAAQVVPIGGLTAGTAACWALCLQAAVAPVVIRAQAAEPTLVLTVVLAEEHLFGRRFQGAVSPGRETEAAKVRLGRLTLRQLEVEALALQVATVYREVYILPAVRVLRLLLLERLLPVAAVVAVAAILGPLLVLAARAEAVPGE